MSTQPSQEGRCLHLKVYDHAICFATNSRHWICKLCGEMGNEKVGDDEFESEYNDLVKRFHGHD